MKQELSIPTGKSEKTFNMSLSMETLTALLANSRPMRAAARLYSGLMGEKVTPRQATYFLYAQLTGLMALLPAPVDAGWRVCALAAFVWAVKGTRR